MKAVLISIQPKYCKLIADGKKTIEVRKTCPKQERPFKVYIYMTMGGVPKYIYNKNLERESIYEREPSTANGRVVGEFVCDKIEDFRCCSVPYKKENNLGYGYFIDNGVYKVNGWYEGVVFERNDRYIDSMLKNKELKEMCLSAQEIFDYIGIGKHLYGWHISQLKIYDKPKELSEFKLPCTNKQCASWCKDMKINDKMVCENKDKRFIKRPPQSWCYVEELK